MTLKRWNIWASGGVEREENVYGEFVYASEAEDEIANLEKERDDLLDKVEEYQNILENVAADILYELKRMK